MLGDWQLEQRLEAHDKKLQELDKRGREQQVERVQWTKVAREDRVKWEKEQSGAAKRDREATINVAGLVALTVIGCVVADRYKPELTSLTAVGGTALTFLKLFYDVTNRT